LPRRPGQKEERFMQLLGGEAEAAPEPQAAPAYEPSGRAGDRVGELEARVERLEDEVSSLRDALDALRNR